MLSFIFLILSLLASFNTSAKFPTLDEIPCLDHLSKEPLTTQDFELAERYLSPAIRENLNRYDLQSQIQLKDAALTYLRMLHVKVKVIPVTTKIQILPKGHHPLNRFASCLKDSLGIRVFYSARDLWRRIKGFPLERYANAKFEPTENTLYLSHQTILFPGTLESALVHETFHAYNYRSRFNLFRFAASSNDRSHELGKVGNRRVYSFLAEEIIAHLISAETLIQELKIFKNSSQWIENKKSHLTASIQSSLGYIQVTQNILSKTLHLPTLNNRSNWVWDEKNFKAFLQTPLLQIDEKSPELGHQVILFLNDLTKKLQSNLGVFQLLELQRNSDLQLYQDQIDQMRALVNQTELEFLWIQSI